MRFLCAILTALVAVSGLVSTARAEAALSLVFTGNSWGYLKPCPT